MFQIERPTSWGLGVMADNVNDSTPPVLQLIRDRGVHVGLDLSGAKPFECLEVPGPVSIVYRSPTRRVMFDEARNANPFAQMFDALLLISGSPRTDLVDMVTGDTNHYGANFRENAYGYRMRRVRTEGGEIDQLNEAVAVLRRDAHAHAFIHLSRPDQMGTPTAASVTTHTLDFYLRNGLLHLDIYSAQFDATRCNATRWSVLHELLAVAIGAEVGFCTRHTHSLYAPMKSPFWQAFLRGEHDHGHVLNPYMEPGVQPYPIALSAAEALQVIVECGDLAAMAENAGSLKLFAAGLTTKDGTYECPFSTDFMRSVVWPMLCGYIAFRQDWFEGAFQRLSGIQAVDWRAVCLRWVHRRKEDHDIRMARIAKEGRK